MSETKTHRARPGGVFRDQLRHRAADERQRRLLLYAESGDSIPLPFLIVLVLWLTIIFGGFSLFASPNASVITVLFVCALSASSAVYLILELGRPFGGLTAIPSAPLCNVLAPLGL